MEDIKTMSLEEVKKIADEVKYQPRLLAQKWKVSLRTLQRAFKARGLPSPREYLHALRLTKVRDYLKQGCSVKEAAARTHYQHPGHLTGAFKRFFGCLPSTQSSRRSLSQVPLLPHLALVA